MKIGAAWAVVILALLVGCGTLNKWVGMKDDNVLENSVEDLIELGTGAQIDLTPGSHDDGFHIMPRNEDQHVGCD